MYIFVVLGLVFSIPRQEIGLGKRLRNGLSCVDWDVKPQLNQSINQSIKYQQLHRVRLVVFFSSYGNSQNLITEIGG